MSLMAGIRMGNQTVPSMDMTMRNRMALSMDLKMGNSMDSRMGIATGNRMGLNMGARMGLTTGIKMERHSFTLPEIDLSYAHQATDRRQEPPNMPYNSSFG